MGVSEQLTGGLTSVIVPCLGSSARTQLCLGALLRQTRRPWELVALVDEAGPIAAYVRGIRDSVPIHVAIVEHPSGSDISPFAAGIRAACGDSLVWLADDTIVTDGWLEQLSALARSRPDFGMTGPLFNDAEPPQLARGADYSDLAGLRRFADRWRSEHRGQWLTTRRLADSCVLIKRHALESADGLDAHDVGSLAAKIRDAGFSMAVANDLVVHRFGNREVPAQDLVAEAWIRTGAGDYPAKGWGADPRGPVSRPASRRPSEVDGRGPRPKVSLTMIVRDEEANLEGCLRSAQGLCDELVIVDTGSTDRTAEVARSFGALVVDFTWIDDFAAARNVALDNATGRYAFWLDADDRIDEANHRRLRDLFETLGDVPAAYVMKQLSVTQVQFETTTSADHVRLFPIRDDVRWSYRVHEQILPAIRGARIPVHWTEIGIGHVGYNDPRLRRHKLDRNLRILLAELLERPADPFVLFNIGWVALDRNEPRTALGYLRASLAGSSPRDSIVRKLYVLIARASLMLGEPGAALAACSAGRAIDPDDAELLFREALVRRELGDASGAEACWRRILDLGPPRKFSSIVTGIYGHLTRRKLAELAEQRGERAEAARYWREVLAECPRDREALMSLERLLEA